MTFVHYTEQDKKRYVHLLILAVQPFDLENLFLAQDGTYTGLQAYKNSKLANVLFAYELTRQLEGSGVKVNAVDPGETVNFSFKFFSHCYRINTCNYSNSLPVELSGSLRVLTKIACVIR